MKTGISFMLSGLILCSRAGAQLPVSREPHHKVILQNDRIRILDGHIPAHDTTPPHLHAANSVVVFLSLSTFGIRTPGGSPVLTRVRPGDMKYAAYGDKPVTHIVWNESASVFHFYVVELAKTPGGRCPGYSLPGVQLQWTQRSVAAFYVEPPNGRTVRLPSTDCARLLIDLSGTFTATAATGSYTRKREGFVYFPPGTPVDIRGDRSRCILLEIP